MAVHPVLINWIADFLSNRLQRTKIGQDYSAWKHIQAGVPQGTKLGPLFFLIMVNDLIPATDLVKFVDDSTTWEVLHRDSQSNLPSAVKACEEWSCDNNMKLNASKTKEMRVNFSSSSPSYPPIVINNQIVNIVTHAKLLGITISNDLKWNLHINAVCKKASKHLYAFRLLKGNALLDSVLVKVSCACIRPILEYAFKVWLCTLITKLNRSRKEPFKLSILPLPIKRCSQQTFHRCTIAKAPFASVFSTECLIVPALRINEHNLCHNRCFRVPVSRTDRYHKSFIPFVASLYDMKHF